jgi:hypothetical protein
MSSPPPEQQFLAANAELLEALESAGHDVEEERQLHAESVELVRRVTATKRRAGWSRNRLHQARIRAKPRRLDRRLGCGRPPARRTSRATRAGPSSDDDPPGESDHVNRQRRPCPTRKGVAAVPPTRFTGWPVGQRPVHPWLRRDPWAIHPTDRLPGYWRLRDLRCRVLERRQGVTR